MALRKAEMIVSCAVNELCCPEDPKEKKGVSYLSFPWRDILTEEIKSEENS